MITLTELYFSKTSMRFEETPTEVNMSLVKCMRPNVSRITAPTMVASMVFGDKIPSEYYKEVASTSCTTLYFLDGSEVDVKETVDEIKHIEQCSKE